MAGYQRVTGRRAPSFPPRRTQWDFTAVADGEVYLLSRGEDFHVEVGSMAAAARRWARQHGYTITTRSKFDEENPERPKIGLYVHFERQAT